MTHIGRMISCGFTLYLLWRLHAAEDGLGWFLWIIVGLAAFEFAAQFIALVVKIID